MSFKVEVLAFSGSNWVSNSLRFGTPAEAEDYGANLTSQWLSLSEFRAVESTDPINYRYVDGVVTPLEVAS